MIAPKSNFQIRLGPKDYEHAGPFCHHTKCVIAEALQRRGFENIDVGGYQVTIGMERFNVRTRSGDTVNPTFLGYSLDIDKPNALAQFPGPRFIVFERTVLGNILT